MGASKGRIKERRERRALDVSAPILLSDLGTLGADDSIEERDDGIKGVGEVSAWRPGRTTKRPITGSQMQNLEAAVGWVPDWQRAAEIDEVMRHDGPGLRMDTNAMSMLIFEHAILEYGTALKAERELADPDNWGRLCRMAERLYPDDPTRRLHEKPPTYKQWWLFRKKYLGDIEELRKAKRAVAVGVALRIGLFDPELGSVTHPSGNNVAYGDAKVLSGRFNTPPIDPKTGQTSQRRHDPDMHPYHKGDKRTGRRMVTVAARGDGFSERVILDITTMHVTEGSDGSRYADMVLELNEIIPIQAGCYDMAVYSNEHDRLMAAGIAPVSKVHRNGKSQPKSLQLGEHTFHLVDGTEQNHPVIVVDGWPGTIVPTVEGKKWAALEPVQVKKARNKNGTWRWWQYWRVRDLPEIPRRLIGAVVHIRHSRSADDGDKSRSRVLRLFPEGSPGYKEVFRRRNDIESMHRHLQDMLQNDRVPVVGDRNLRLWLHSYQTRVLRTALIAWHYRTGGDISPWFGEWKPPPRRRATAA